MVVVETSVGTSDEKTDFGIVLFSRHPVADKVPLIDLADHVVDSVGVGALRVYSGQRDEEALRRGTFDVGGGEAVHEDGGGSSGHQPVRAVE